MYPSPFQLRKRASTTILCASVSFVPPKGAPALSRLINYGPFSRREMVTAVWCGEAKLQVASLEKENTTCSLTPPTAPVGRLWCRQAERPGKNVEKETERERVWGWASSPAPSTHTHAPGVYSPVILISGASTPDLTGCTRVVACAPISFPLKAVLLAQTPGPT